MTINNNQNSNLQQWQVKLYISVIMSNKRFYKHLLDKKQNKTTTTKKKQNPKPTNKQEE